MTAKPETDLVAEIHVAGPIESEPVTKREGRMRATSAAKAGELVKVSLTSETVVEATLVQRCLRCDVVLAICGSAEHSTTWKLGTRVGVITDRGRSRVYVLDRGSRLGIGEENCVDRIGR